MVVSVDIQAVPVEHVGTQPGDALSLVAQVPVQSCWVQLPAGRLGTIGADGINSDSPTILLRPQPGESTAQIADPEAAVVEQVPKLAIQDSLYYVEALRAWHPQILRVAQVGDGEIEGKGHWDRASPCRVADGGLGRG